MENENLYTTLNSIKEELNELNKCCLKMENNYRDCKKDLKELRLLYEKLKGIKAIF